MEAIIESIISAAAETSTIEIIAVVSSIAYAWLASKNNIWCWLFGVISPIFSMYALYYYFNLYAEALLQIYYVIMAIYGFYIWKFGSVDHDEKPIDMWSVKKHLIVISIGFILTFSLGFVLENFTDAASSYLDSFTTVFAILATFMTARRILENWIYWIVIDSISIFLYANRGGYLFALLFIAYTLIAIHGFIYWRKTYKSSHV